MQNHILFKQSNETTEEKFVIITKEDYVITTKEDYAL